MTGKQEVPCAVEIRDLHRRFASTEAVRGLNLKVGPGACYGLFGRNGAGKTTTIKCLLGHLRPTKGEVLVFGLNPLRDEVEVKRRIGYVPETMGFYPWMTARDMLDYAASFRPSQWNRVLEKDLLTRFELDAGKKIKNMSKGMRAQLSLICAIAAEPDLLLLDEPTSGLDPVVRREFIETVIGAYQEGDPEGRTVFVSTHLIGEWEGLIDEFTIIDQGREKITMSADAARAAYRRIRLIFADTPPEVGTEDGICSVKTDGRSVEIVTDKPGDEIRQRLGRLAPKDILEEPLSLEEIFVATARIGGVEVIE
jgi:ABC-2 type transport system ATP-binding protein